MKKEDLLARAQEASLNSELDDHPAYSIYDVNDSTNLTSVVQSALIVHRARHQE